MNVSGVEQVGRSTNVWLGGVWINYAALVILGAALIIAIVAFFKRRETVEDPARLRRFLDAVQTLDWSSETSQHSLSSLSGAVVELFRAEVEYYYKTRLIRRRTSGLFRWQAFIFGTAGLLCPLVEVAIPTAVGASRLGYLLLAIAAAGFAGNELFGGTKGHVRTVTAQYELERILNRFIIELSEWRSTGEVAGVNNASGFVLLKKMSEDVYATLLGETREWGSTLVEAERAYQAGIRKGAAGTGQ